MKKFYLFLDESGNFKDNDIDKSPSLVGGVLFEKDLPSVSELNKMIPEDFLHSNEVHDSTRYIDILNWLTSKGKLIIFNNEERLSVVNGDLTYLNILCEGLVQLLTALETEHGAVELNVICATRVRSDKEGIVLIESDDYISRLQEKLALAIYKKNIKSSYSLSLDSARKNKYLMFSDVVCNTFLTKFSRKFDSEQKAKINNVFAKNDKWYFSVFEDATIGNINKLILDDKIGEAVFEICAIISKSKVKYLTEIIIKRLTSMSKRERDLNLEYVKNQIALLINTNQYSEVEVLLKNFDQEFLCTLQEQNINIDILRFDIYFYLITLYSKRGNTIDALKYIEICDSKVECLGSSWDGLGKYFSYQIRKCHNYINCFEFEKAIEFSTQIIENLSSLRDVISMIDDVSKTFGIISSDLLAKAYGTRMQAYTELTKKDKNYYDLAVKDSDWAIMEFADKSDISRQYQYRCQLELAVGKTYNAWKFFCKSLGIEQEFAYESKEILNTILNRLKNERCFDLLHYISIIEKLSALQNANGNLMYRAFTQQQALYKEIVNSNNAQYPIPIILWKIAKINQVMENRKASIELYNKAIDLAFLDNDNFTMSMYGMFILSDYIVFQYDINGDYKNLLRKFAKRITTNPNIEYYYKNKIDLNSAEKNIVSQLKKLAI